jgi:hypothetical protein
MQIREGKAPGSGRLAGIGVELSRGARVRLAWMDFYRGCDNVAHTCRHFGISRQTFYRWQRRYDPYDLTTLEERSHRPRQCRLPIWAFQISWSQFALQTLQWAVAVFLVQSCAHRVCSHAFRGGVALDGERVNFGDNR